MLVTATDQTPKQPKSIFAVTKFKIDRKSICN